MTQYTPPFGPSGSSHSEGSVPDPGSTAGTSKYLREDRTWAVPNAGPPGPNPPPPGPALDQWACNAAGFIIYECCYKLTKAAIDTNFFSLALDAIIGFAFDSLAEILLPLEILDSGFLTWLENWVASSVQANLATFLAHIEDQALWSKFHCFLYNEIRTAGNASNATLLAAGTALAASGISPSQVTNGIALILQQFGVMSVGPIPLSAFVQNYDCSTCASGGTDSAPIPIQPGFDLIVSDGTNRQGFIDEVDFPGATATFTGSKASLSFSGGVGSVTASSPLASSGGSNPDISLASPVPTNLGGLGIDSSAFAKGSILANTGSGWNGDAPTLDGLVLTSDSTQPGGVSWTAPGTVSAAGPWYSVTFPPALLHWTKPNAGTALYADVTGGVAIDTGVESSNTHMLVRSVSVPYDAIGAFVPAIYSGSGQPGAGLCVMDTGSGKLTRFEIVNNVGSFLLAVSYWSSASVGVSNLLATSTLNGPLFVSGPPFWFRIKNDGTTRSYWISRDGVHFLQVASEAHNANMSENSAGFFADSGGSGVSVGCTLISWNL